MWRERFERVQELVRKEFLQLFRDPRMWRVVFVAPVIQLIVFGYAVSTDIQNTPTFVVDASRTVESRELIDAFTASGYFQVVERSLRPADAVRALDRGEALVGLVLPVDFAEALRSGQGAAVQLLLDGTQSNTASVAQGYAERIVQDYAARIGGRAALAVELRERAWFNAEPREPQLQRPGGVGRDHLPRLPAAHLARGRARARDRNARAAHGEPARPASLIAGKTIPFAIIGFVDVILVTVAALLWFRVPFVGSLALLAAASLLFILSSLGIGLLISTVSKTQQEAFMATFLVFMPTILLSGFMFPVNSMPEPIQWLTAVNPMRHYLEVVRGIYLKGAGVAPLAVQYLALLLLGTGLLAVAAARFRKRVR